ncbi:MAG: YitT family protein [Lachnospiraceae bacterium]|nr:YitT family protein [Lachnospiraceae bacterium]
MNSIINVINIKKFKIKNLMMLTLAGIINAFGITLFLTPVKLYDSGISGTSMLLDQITPAYLTLSLFLLVLNIPMFLIGLKKQGLLFTVYSIYTVTIYSVFAWLITNVFPIDVSIASPLAGTDLLLCALFGGVISGIGSGFAIRYGGAMDGIEVMAVIFAKRIGITVGTFVMMYNIILYIICGIVLKSWILPLYSIVTYTAALKTIDFIVEGIDRAKCAIIITEKPDKICKMLGEAFGSGVTRLNAKGAYSHREKAMIYFVINRYQVIRMKDIVHAIDPHAYITISEVADVFSNNSEKE